MLNLWSALESDMKGEINEIEEGVMTGGQVKAEGQVCIINYQIIKKVLWIILYLYWNIRI